MAFNPTKCTVLRVRGNRQRQNISYPYTLHGHKLDEDKSPKYLGVTFSDDLTWSNHIAGVAAKGQRTLGFAKRNFWQCPKPIRETVYKTLVRPVLEYACPVWDPHLQKDKILLERVQRRAARFAANNYQDRRPGSMTKLLRDLKWGTLEQRRNTISLQVFHKCHNHLIDIQFPSNITKGDQRTRGSNKYHQCRCDTVQETNSFYHRTIRKWNLLPQNTRSAETAEEFARLLASQQ